MQIDLTHTNKAHLQEEKTKLEWMLEVKYNGVERLSDIKLSIM